MTYRTDLIQAAIARESLSAIADRSGVSIDTVARARDGEDLSVKSLEAIAISIGLKLSDLFTDQSEADQPLAAAA